MARHKFDLGDISSDLEPFTGQGLSGMIGNEQSTIVPGDEYTLSSSEADELHRCEIIIERGLKTFFEVGAALLRVRDLRLYRGDYTTFEDYCHQRWGMSRPHAYRLIDAAQVQANLSPIGDILPTNEAQTRPLTKLKDPEQQREAWQQAIASAAGRVTAMHVARVVRAMLTQAERADATSVQASGAEHALTDSEGKGTLQGRITELEQQRAAALAIIAEYREQIAHAQQYPSDSEQGALVSPLVQALERVVAVLEHKHERD